MVPGSGAARNVSASNPWRSRRLDDGVNRTRPVVDVHCSFETVGIGAPNARNDGTQLGVWPGSPTDAQVGKGETGAFAEATDAGEGDTELLTERQQLDRAIFGRGEQQFVVVARSGGG